MADKGPKVTIYFKAVGGSIGKLEGYLRYIMDANVGANVAYVKKGARKESLVSSYYSPFWLIAKGWGNPDAESMWDPASKQDTGDVVTMRSRYSYADPRWADNFLSTVAKKLDVWASYRDKKLLLSPEGRKYVRKPGEHTEDTMQDRFNTLLEALEEAGPSQVAKQLHAQLQSFQDMLRSHSQDLSKAAAYLKQLEPSMRAAISKGNAKIIEDAAELMSHVNKELNECHLPLAEAVDKLHHAVAVELPDWKRG